MAFTAESETGRSVESASVEALRRCGEHKLHATVALHNNVLATLAKRSPPEATLSWLARMRASRVPLDVVACNIQLKAYERMGDLAAAGSLLTQMMREADGLPAPDACSYNTVIAAMAHTQPTKAEALLTTMLDTGLAATEISFTSVIVAYAKAGRPKEAGKWLQRMLDSNVNPDTIACNAVLLAYANAGDADGAFHLLRHFETRARDECPNAKPDECSYNTVISACARAGRPAQAEEAFAALIAGGLNPGQLSYSGVMNAHAKAGDSRSAQAWLDKMGAAGIAPDAVSFNTVCSAHARVGDVTSAVALLGAMEAAGVSANPTTHAIMVNALVQAGDAPQAEKTLQRLLAQGTRVSASCFNTLISSYAKAKDPEASLRVLSLMKTHHVPPSLTTFNSVAAAHAACGDLARTEAVLAEAAAAGFPLDRYSYGALLQAVSKCCAPNSTQGRELGLLYVRRLLDSGVQLNDHLNFACRRVLGDEAFARLQAEHRAAPPARQTRSRQAASSGTALSSPGTALPSGSAWGGPRRASGGSGGGSSADGAWRRRDSDAPPGLLQPSPGPAIATPEPEVKDSVMADGDDEGWISVTPKDKNKSKRSPSSPLRSSRRSASERVPPSPVGRGGLGGGGGIQKDNQVKPKTPTRRPASGRQASSADSKGAEATSPPRAPPVAVLDGVRLTRSKSERDRLAQLSAQLAQGVESASAEAMGLGTAPPPGISLTQPSPWGNLNGAAGLPPGLPPGATGLPLKRSAASELALTLCDIGMDQ